MIKVNFSVIGKFLMIDSSMSSTKFLKHVHVILQKILKQGNLRCSLMKRRLDVSRNRNSSIIRDD